MSEPKTRVLFRVDCSGDFKGSVTAIFPDVPYSSSLVTSYAHVGQHGAASMSWVRQNTRPATTREYAALKRELETIGYTLTIGRRA